MNDVRVTEGGVSYVLLHEGKTYSFRGHLDFVGHQQDIDAHRILISTGEIQSTNIPDVQNCIYGVESLLKRDSTPHYMPHYIRKKISYPVSGEAGEGVNK